MLLTDGGVYDNMATEWPIRLDERLPEGGAPTPSPGTLDELPGSGSSRSWRHSTVPMPPVEDRIKAAKDGRLGRLPSCTPHSQRWGCASTAGCDSAGRLQCRPLTDGAQLLAKLERIAEELPMGTGWRVGSRGSSII
jgi:hypothetical protein